MLRAISRAVAFTNLPLKSFHTSALVRLREIVERQEGNKTIIECRRVESPRKPYLLKVDKKDNKCPLCRLNLDLKYTDVLILSQYIDSVGNIMRKSETSLCDDQYKLVRELIFMAQYARLLPEPPRQEPRKPYLLLNTYYDETTINLHPKRRLYDQRFAHLRRRLAPIERFRISPERGTNIRFYKP